MTDTVMNEDRSRRIQDGLTSHLQRWVNTLAESRNMRIEWDENTTKRAAWTSNGVIHLARKRFDLTDPNAVEDLITSVLHELGHLLYSPRSNSKLTDYVRYGSNRHSARKAKKAMNLLEDFRNETILATHWPTTATWFTNLTVRVVLGGSLQPGDFVYIAGREYLPPELLAMARDIWPGGPEDADKMRAIAAEYTRLRNPSRDVKTAARLIDDFADFMHEDDKGGCQEERFDPDGTASSNTEVKMPPPPPLPEPPQETEKEEKQDDRDPEGPTSEQKDSDSEEDKDESEDESSDSGDSGDSDTSDGGEETAESEETNDGESNEDEGANSEDESGSESSEDTGESEGEESEGKGSDESEGEESATSSQDEEGGDSDSSDDGQDSGEGSDEGAEKSDGEPGEDSNNTSGDTEDSDTTSTEESESSDDTSEGGGSGLGKNTAEQLLKEILEDTRKSEEFKDALEAYNGAFDEGIKHGKGLPKAPLTGSSTFTRPEHRRAADKIAHLMREITSRVRPGWHKRKRVGSFDVPSYISQIQNPRRVFKKYDPGQMRALDIHVELLVDQSGSMGAQSHPAVEMSHTIKVACDKIGATCAVHMFGGEAVTLWDADQRANPAEVPYYSDGGGTRVKPALLEAYRNCVRRDASVKLVFILTDGGYTDLYPGTEELKSVMTAISRTGARSHLFFLSGYHLDASIVRALRDDRFTDTAHSITNVDAVIDYFRETLIKDMKHVLATHSRRAG